ncbi:hypothetical protein CPT03_22365 [Pedobacter ginsengisoli]|uniref:Protein FecR C-terminal domain-containing protein n=1 Tax=Pedobacter ginsengisoli TaxID=363852 RepID=A0A2D1UBY0_9SPHI|nr:DUF4974 domain-containing protein [Pedobacter ginsengisoli]ATP59014.1 hypothetical protein CPT03_22365 [Pedobacter ginsengisoli]
MRSEVQTKIIIALIGKQIRGELSAIDELTLRMWVSESDSNKILFDRLTDSAYRQAELAEMRSFTSAPAAFANFMEKYGERIPAEGDVYVPPKIEVERKVDYEFLKYGTTAVIFLALSIGFFIYLNNKDLLENTDSHTSALAKSEMMTDHNYFLGLNTDEKTTDNYDVRLKEYITWKQGLFTFNKETLESLMQRIAHWYDVDVIYSDGNIGKTLYTGTALRFNSITSLLNKLEKTGPAKFKVEGRKVLVQLHD